jgi:hypothetical protein
VTVGMRDDDLFANRKRNEAGDHDQLAVHG